MDLSNITVLILGGVNLFLINRLYLHRKMLVAIADAHDAHSDLLLKVATEHTLFRYAIDGLTERVEEVEK